MNIINFLFSFFLTGNFPNFFINELMGINNLMVINYLSDLFLIEIIPGDEANNSKIYPVLLKIGDLLLELLDNNSLTI